MPPASMISCLFEGITLTNMFLLSENQFITLPIFEFNFKSKTFFAEDVFKSRIQRSTPNSVVFVNAILV